MKLFNLIKLTSLLFVITVKAEEETSTVVNGTVVPVQPEGATYIAAISGKVSLTMAEDFTCTGKKAASCGRGCVANFTLSVSQNKNDTTRLNDTNYYSVEFTNFPPYFVNDTTKTSCQCTNSFSMFNGKGDNTTTGLTFIVNDDESETWHVEAGDSGKQGLTASCDYSFTPPETNDGGLRCTIHTADDVTCTGNDDLKQFVVTGGSPYPKGSQSNTTTSTNLPTTTATPKSDGFKLTTGLLALIIISASFFTF
ncbi:hypothetical protein HK099_005457 [Clydaea vesicula]|uniref:Uncharacterized protein n=1 Tax=Clydaea vesicula TaxID=447962 RepID=A0AAD5TZ59_9FUNG|nr:hypothetical protein HK099_005457 [Clydaea vesicula]